MSYKFEEGKEFIINALVEKLKAKMPSPQAQLCSEFVRQFYSTASLEDLQEWDLEDLYGSAINFWSLIQHREPKETKIRIYNPDYERHGWQTTHTVVEVITEDMPFIVDSLRMVINHMDLACHLVINTGGICFKRDQQHNVVAVLTHCQSEDKDVFLESPIFMEIDRQTDAAILQELHHNFEHALEDNRAVVEDWSLMRARIRGAITELDEAADFLDKDELEETKAFLKWIEDHHFTLLAVRDYELVKKNGDSVLQPILESGLGLMRSGKSKSTARLISAMTPEAKDLIRSPRALIMSKTNMVSTVHRDAYADYIGVKRYNSRGEVIGECRIIGLYTSAAYNTSPRYIPFLRHKVELVMKNSGLHPHSHAGKVLLNILETLPRDDLIQASEDELLQIGMGIYYMQDRPKIRMFARVDVYHRFISCLIYVPKDRFNPDLRQTMEQVLADAFHVNTQDVTLFATRFSESVLARIHFIIRINPKDKTQWDFKEIEQRLIEAGRSWIDDLKHYLFEAFGEEKGNQLFARYKNTFPNAYCDTFGARAAVYDIKHIESLSTDNNLVINFYRSMDDVNDNFHLKIYQQADEAISLSDVLPIIENLGMRAINERPYELHLKEGKAIWVSDFTMHYTQEAAFEVDDIKELFQQAFTNIWSQEAENDRFNKLILASELNWREVSVLRAYARYFKQIGFIFSQEYMEAALSNHPAITKKLMELFTMRFDPKLNPVPVEAVDAFVESIIKALDNVSNLDEDKIIRQYVHAIMATLRTNFYQLGDNKLHKNCISFKFDSRSMPNVPRPYPLYEVFVYAPRFEAVHLRFNKVARGGLRWSDRKEDFRTEILGLAKAQQVKNAQIVPSGAKGGFVPKRLPVNGTREEIHNEAVACYQHFIRGLLDITDNYVNGEVIKPQQVVCYDGDDPYLVVAADKGTATFSDIANAISLEYGFWLGDAFASGGSVGYDHKKMGITARGAWESVKRHFYEMNLNIEMSDFTVVGIGDMAGDVFGNGMLLSNHIKLVAAFNHVHIFIDPSPDPIASFKERYRLFHLPRSNWTDYDRNVISAGGGVFNRSAKSIILTPEIKTLLDLTQDEIEPNELIRAILKARVDLLWSAGIGTFVKSDKETHLDVGDRTNDPIRINAPELRCKVVGEGGNLGLTQLARIQYELNNGLIFTDFIDNSGGVNCSDKEVNIKILLNAVVASGDLTVKQRNELLASMTDEVAALVLHDNFAQPRAISYSSYQSVRSLQLYSRYMNELVSRGKIDRELEFLPDEKTLMERKLAGKGLTRPEIAVLLCYSKIQLKEQILATDVPEDTYLKRFLVKYFPQPLQKSYSQYMQAHPLKREIITTALSNMIVNEMGPVYIFRMQDETGASIAAIVRAYVIAVSVMNFDNIWKKIAIFESILDISQQIDIAMLYVRLLRRVSRWFLRNQRVRLNISATIKRYSEGVSEIKQVIPAIYGEKDKKQYDHFYKQYLETGLDESLAHELSVTRALFPAMDIIDVALKFGYTTKKVAELYYSIGEFLELNWIRTQIIAHSAESNWESMSREALRDDLDWQQRQLLAAIINLNGEDNDFLEAFEKWKAIHANLIERWRQILTELRASTSLSYTMFFVAIRELLDLTQTTIQSTEKEVVMEK